MEAVKTILAMVSNLMYTVKIRETASKLGATTAFVDSAQEMADKLASIHPSLLIFDLTSLRPGWQDVVKTAKTEGIPVIAYGPHVDTEGRNAAIQAGCDEVYANSKFTLDLPNILQKALR
jgi:CheY-like chemotaxis protein